MRMPPGAYDVVEIGDDEEIMACILHVLARRIFENMLDDVCVYLEDCGFRVIQLDCNHKWTLAQRLNEGSSVIEVKLHFSGNQSLIESLALLILERLGAHYGFRIGKIVVDRRCVRASNSQTGEDYFIIPPPVRVETILTFFELKPCFSVFQAG